MPLLLLPLLVVLVMLVVVALFPLSLLLRYRRGTARQLARGWLTALNLIGLAVSTALLLTTAAVTTFWAPLALASTLAGLAAGGVLGLLGLWLSRWETTPETLHYTPSRLLVLVILIVVISRIAYGVWRGWSVWQSGPGDESWLAAAGAAGSLAVGAVVLGYYLVYWLGVWRRLARHRRRGA